MNGRIAAIIRTRRQRATGFIEAFNQLKARPQELLFLSVAADVVMEHREIVARIVQQSVIGFATLVRLDRPAIKAAPQKVDGAAQLLDRIAAELELGPG